jgi:hypothetical protein
MTETTGTLEIEAAQRADIEREAPIVALFGAMCRLKEDNKLDFFPMIPVKDILSDKDAETIDDIENYILPATSIIPNSPIRVPNPNHPLDKDRTTEVKAELDSTVFKEFSYKQDLPSTEVITQEHVVKVLVKYRDKLKNDIFSLEGYQPGTYTRYQ